MRLREDELRDILSRCREFVLASNDSGWSCMDVSEIVVSLNESIDSLARRNVLDKNELVMLFAPTGPLQETAMRNGWADEYISLSARFDKMIREWA